MRCHYEVLGVDQEADQDELKKAYRKQVRTKSLMK
jgi:curved DNA-binding protein CbpA